MSRSRREPISKPPLSGATGALSASASAFKPGATPAVFAGVLSEVEQSRVPRSCGRGSQAVDHGRAPPYVRVPWSCAVAGPCPSRFARTQPWRHYGLTLIELMVAMTASAVIFLAALRAFQQGRFVGTHIDRQMTRAAGVYDLWQLLASDVGSSFILESPEEAGAWVGGADSMRFLAVRPEGRPVEVEYRFTKAPPGSGALGQIVRSTRFCSGSVAIGAWERTVIAEGVVEFSLRYAAAAEGSDGLAWMTEFRGERAGPRAVEVRAVRARLDGAGPEECRWVIAARAQAPAGGGA